MLLSQMCLFTDSRKRAAALVSDNLLGEKVGILGLRYTVSRNVERFLVTVPIEENVRRTGDPNLWVLINALKCGVDT